MRRRQLRHPNGGIMLRINQIKLKPNHTGKELEHAVHKALRLGKQDYCTYEIAKRSIDARHKPDLYYVYSITVKDVQVSGKHLSDAQIKKHAKNKDIIEVSPKKYEFSVPISEDASGVTTRNLKLEERPVIIGFGPAGMFAALKLAEAGLCPIVYERGASMQERKQDVERFWQGGKLNTESNVQFGEGGAGTFSDGKLNSVIKDPSGRIGEVLRTFVRFGADASILYVNKPHIGTDVLAYVVENIRKHIEACGGEVHFHSRLDDITFENKSVKQITVTNTQTGERFMQACKNICLSIGHSARDTFAWLNELGVPMQAKPFAVGLRVEHPQEFINQNAYGDTTYQLPTADYKVTYQTSKGRGVYSFCMCPGGYVVNASSEEGQIAVNGMSYSGRNGKNANSAIIVTVSPEDFGGEVLGGVAFQRKLERLAYEQGKGNVPVQLLADFRQNRLSTGFGRVEPCIKGAYTFGNLNKVLPQMVSEAIAEAMPGFARYIKGFDMEDAVFAGVESRTSSPVRIVRNELLESEYAGLFPCGEGAGYAGGITSAAVDGLKVAEKMAQKQWNYGNA